MIDCLICGRKFVRPCTHVRQVHKMSAREYKEEFGLDVKKGIMTDEQKDIMREHTKKNYDVVVKENLLKKGKKSRLKKGEKIIYVRSEQTLERLRKQFIGIGKYKGEVIVPKKEFKCNNPDCGKIFYRHESQLKKSKKLYCSRSCSSTINNTLRKGK